jgi:hypothetical protein
MFTHHLSLAGSSPCPLSYFLKIHFNIILSYMSICPKWPPSLTFSHHTLYAHLSIRQFELEL